MSVSSTNPSVKVSKKPLEQKAIVPPPTKKVVDVISNLQLSSKSSSPPRIAHNWQNQRTFNLTQSQELRSKINSETPLSSSPLPVARSRAVTLKNLSSSTNQEIKTSVTDKKILRAEDAISMQYDVQYKRFYAEIEGIHHITQTISKFSEIKQGCLCHQEIAVNHLKEKLQEARAQGIKIFYDSVLFNEDMLYAAFQRHQKTLATFTKRVLDFIELIEVYENAFESHSTLKILSHEKELPSEKTCIVEALKVFSGAYSVKALKTHLASFFADLYTSLDEACSIFELLKNFVIQLDALINTLTKGCEGYPSFSVVKYIEATKSHKSIYVFVGKERKPLSFASIPSELSELGSLLSTLCQDAKLLTAWHQEKKLPFFGESLAKNFTSLEEMTRKPSPSFLNPKTGQFKKEQKENPLNGIQNELLSLQNLETLISLFSKNCDATALLAISALTKISDHMHAIRKETITFIYPSFFSQETDPMKQIFSQQLGDLAELTKRALFFIAQMDAYKKSFCENTEIKLVSQQKELSNKSSFITLLTTFVESESVKSFRQCLRSFPEDTFSNLDSAKNSFKNFELYLQACQQLAEGFITHFHDSFLDLKVVAYSKTLKCDAPVYTMIGQERKPIDLSVISRELFQYEIYFDSLTKHSEAWTKWTKEKNLKGIDISADFTKLQKSAEKKQTVLNEQMKKLKSSLKSM